MTIAANLQHAQDVLSLEKGLRIASFKGSCYDLWLEEQEGMAFELVQADSWEESVDLVREGKADVLSGVVGLLDKVRKQDPTTLGDWTILSGSFMTVSQAIAFPLNRTNMVGQVVKYLRGEPAL